jgi:hypothetical protein
MDEQTDIASHRDARMLLKKRWKDKYRETACGYEED